jgi:hypothetical protein
MRKHIVKKKKHKKYKLTDLAAMAAQLNAHVHLALIPKDLDKSEVSEDFDKKREHTRQKRARR